MRRILSCWFLLSAAVFSPLASAQTAAPATQSGTEQPVGSASILAPPGTASPGPADTGANPPSEVSRDVYTRAIFVALGSLGGELVGAGAGYLLSNALYPPQNGLDFAGRVQGLTFGGAIGAAGGALLIGALMPPGHSAGTITGILVGTVVGLGGLSYTLNALSWGAFALPILGAAIGYGIGYVLSPPHLRGEDPHRVASAVRLSPLLTVSPRGTGQVGVMAVF